MCTMNHCRPLTLALLRLHTAAAVADSSESRVHRTGWVQLVGLAKHLLVIDASVAAGNTDRNSLRHFHWTPVDIPDMVPV